MTRRLVRIQDACQTLSLSRSCLYGLLKAGAIGYVKVGKRGIRIPTDEIERFAREGIRS